MVGDRRQLGGVTTGKPLAAPFRRAPAMATDGKTLVRRCLNEAIDRSGTKRLALATECGVSEAQFSKLTGGVQHFPLEMLAELPRAVRVDVVRRIAALDGLRVHDPDVVALSADLLDAFEPFLRAYVARAAVGE